jgi:hypothetical protein
MDSLQIELVIGLDRDKAHVLALHGFGDCLCVHKVVLVGLYERLHKLRCYQPYIMALLPQRASEKVCSGTCLQPDQRHLQVCGVCQQLPLREFLARQHLSGYTGRYQVKRCLTKIDANRNYLHIDDPPYQELSSRSTCLRRLIKRRTIPLFMFLLTVRAAINQLAISG